MANRRRVVSAAVALVIALGLVAAPAASQDGGEGTETDAQGGADGGAEPQGDGDGDAGGADGGTADGGEGGDAGDGGAVDAGDAGSEVDQDAGEGSNTDWEVVATIALVGVIVVAVGAVLYAFVSRDRRPSAGGAPSGPSARRRELSRLVGRAQWVHDSVALNVLGADAAALRPYWSDARGEIDSLGASVAAAAAASGEPAEASALRSLGQSLASLTAALDTHVGLRASRAASGDEGVQVAVRESSATVARRRADLQTSVDGLQATMLAEV